MQGNIIIQLLFAIIFIASWVIVSFSLFRIPIRNNDKQIVTISILVGSVNFYTQFILKTPYALIPQLVVFAVLLMIMRRYPIFYAIIVSFTGLFIISIVDAVATITAIQTGLSTLKLMTTKTSDFVAMHSIVTIIILLISFVIDKLKLGFSFVIRRFHGKHVLKIHNYIWAVVLITGLAFLLCATRSFEKSSLHPYIIITVSLGLIASVSYTYIQNKKVSKDRDGE